MECAAYGGAVAEPVLLSSPLRAPPAGKAASEPPHGAG
jgi:hypothetical protein